MTALLSIRDLRVHFPRPAWPWQARRAVRAVDGVSLDVPRGRTVGLVGESGCGKSTVARAVLRLLRATGGSVRLDGVDLLTLPRRALRPMRRRMQLIFQDPGGSLNPRLPVDLLVGEALEAHGLVRGRRARRERVAALLTRVGLAAAALDRYAHEFSGGQRQRIGIARALVLDPDLVVCDEPVSALDVSVQGQVLNLLADLREERGLTYLFIGHNLAVVRQFCDEVAVMYLGRIVEHGAADAVLARPAHPYTRALLAAMPEPVARAGGREALRLAVLPGEPPSPLDPPTGCAFHPRCPVAEPRCRRERPDLRPVCNGALAACHLAV